MSYYFRHWHTAITAESAEAEPMNQRLFAESEDECKGTGATNQPSTNAPKGNRSQPGDLRKYSAPSLSVSEAMSCYHYPPHLAPSALVMLAAQQAGYSFSRMPNLGDMLARVVAGQVEIDTSPAACRKVLRAMQEADDHKAGVARLWVDDLI